MSATSRSIVNPQRLWQTMCRGYTSATEHEFRIGQTLLSGKARAGVKCLQHAVRRIADRSFFRRQDPCRGIVSATAHSRIITPPAAPVP